MFDQREKQFIEKIQRKLYNVNICSTIVQRTVCAELGEDTLINIIGVFKLSETDTVLLRLEDLDGNVIEGANIVACA
jgi:hypothetical protein